jgi:hypothetical protein
MSACDVDTLIRRQAGSVIGRDAAIQPSLTLSQTSSSSPHTPSDTDPSEAAIELSLTNARPETSLERGTREGEGRKQMDPRLVCVGVRERQGTPPQRPVEAYKRRAELREEEKRGRRPAHERAKERQARRRPDGGAWRRAILASAGACCSRRLPSACPCRTGPLWERAVEEGCGRRRRHGPTRCPRMPCSSASACAFTYSLPYSCVMACAHKRLSLQANLASIQHT